MLVAAIAVGGGCQLPVAETCATAGDDCPTGTYCDPEFLYCVVGDAGASLTSDAASDAAIGDRASTDTNVGPDRAEPDAAAVVDAAGQDGDVDAATDAATQADALGDDASGMDAALTDAARPDSSAADAAMPDGAVPDGAVPDSAVPDSALPDSALPDTYTPPTVVEVHESASASIPGSQQQVTVDLAAPVDPSRSLLFFNATTNSIDPDDGQVAGQLINNNQVQFTRSVVSAGIVVDIEWSVVQLSGVRVLRGGEFLGSALTAQASLTPAVDTGRSFPLISMHMGGGRYSFDDFLSARIATAQTLELAREDGCCNTQVEWQVAEFEAAENASVRSGSASIPAGTSALTVDIGASVDLPSSFAVFSYRVPAVGGGASPANFVVDGDLRSASELGFDRDGTEDAIEIEWYVVSWDKISVQRGQESFAVGAQDRTVDLASQVDPARSVSFCPANMRGGKTDHADDGNDLIGDAWFTTALNSTGTQLSLHRGAAVGNAAVSWTVVEFQ